MYIQIKDNRDWMQDNINFVPNHFHLLCFCRFNRKNQNEVCFPAFRGQELGPVDDGSQTSGETLTFTKKLLCQKI